MHILDEDSDNSLERIILYLTQSEASELRDGLEDILKNPKDNHVHISNDNFQKEITICIYNKKDLNGFDERSKKIILED